MSVQIIQADARHLPLADDSVDLIVTSPPYFGLRSYQDGGEHYAGQIGAEPSPADYVDALTECTRERLRVCGRSGIPRPPTCSTPPHTTSKETPMPRVRILLDADFRFGDGTETGESITIDLTTVSSNREALSAAVQAANVALDDTDRRQMELLVGTVVRGDEEGQADER